MSELAVLKRSEWLIVSFTAFSWGLCSCCQPLIKKLVILFEFYVAIQGHRGPSNIFLAVVMCKRVPWTVDLVIDVLRPNLTTVRVRLAQIHKYTFPGAK